MEMSASDWIGNGIGSVLAFILYRMSLTLDSIKLQLAELKGRLPKPR
jgi:hypothetical protein